MLDSLEKDLKFAVGKYISKQENILSERIMLLENLSPLKVLARGYSLVYKGNNIVRSSDDVSPGDTVRIDFGDSGADAEIKTKW